MCGRPRCWQWSITPINTRYSSLFFICQKHIFENQSNTNSCYLSYFCFFVLFLTCFIFDNDYTHEGWSKTKIFVTLNWIDISLAFHHHELRFARVGQFFTPRIGLYRSAKMGRENVIMQLKEDTQCQFAWDYEQENVRKLFNFNFARGKRKIVLIKFYCDQTSFL